VFLNLFPIVPYFIPYLLSKSVPLCLLLLLCLGPFVSSTFDLFDSLWFHLIGFGHLVWWLVVGLLSCDDVVVLDSLNLS